MKHTQIIADVNEIGLHVDFTPLNGRRILITGANGLLGTYIYAALSYARTFGYSYDIDLQVRRRPELIHAVPGMKLHYADLSNPNDCARLPEADVVICAHAHAQPLRFMAEPLAALRSSAHGLMALLEKCRVGGRFLYLSSSEIYIDSPAKPPYREQDVGRISPYHPRACYIAAKLFGEAMVYLYRQRGISTVSVRPGITFGPGFRMDDQRSWAQFVRQAVENKEIRLRDAGKVKRTFCYIQDGIEMLFRVLLEGRQEVYNLAGNRTMSIAETAAMIAETAGARVIIPEDDQGVAGTPEALAMSHERYGTEFGVHHYIDVKEGFARTLQWYREAYA